MATQTQKPTFPFVEIAYVTLFADAIGWNYLVSGFPFIFVPPARLDDFTRYGDQVAVAVAWFFGFGLFLCASSFQLLRVYLRVILSDSLDKEHVELERVFATRRLHLVVRFFHYVLRLAAILLLLFIEKSVRTPSSNEAASEFFQRWSLALLCFYFILIAYSVCVSTVRASWAHALLTEHGTEVGRRWKVLPDGTPPLVAQAYEAYWQAVGWRRTDVIIFIAYWTINWICRPDGGQTVASLVVLIPVVLCAVASAYVFVLEWRGPLREDVAMLLRKYSVSKTIGAAVLSWCLWVSAKHWLEPLLVTAFR